MIFNKIKNIFHRHSFSEWEISDKQIMPILHGVILVYYERECKVCGTKETKYEG